jgi:hypothetical protein
VISTCQDGLGPVKYQHKEWIPVKTLAYIADRKAKKTTIDNNRTRVEKTKHKGVSKIQVVTKIKR